MADRRATGALEVEVMTFLWALERPATPAEVHQLLVPDLAYTTVMTILTRLWQKGMLERDRQGRAYAYRPVSTEAEHRAGEMRTTLQQATDRAAVLSSFVSALDDGEAELLERFLDREQDD